MPDDADKDDQTVTYNRLKSQARVVFARGPWIESHPLSPNKNNRCYKTLAYGGNNCIIGGSSTIETVSGMIFPSSSSSLAYLHDDPSSFSTKVKEDHCSINRRISVVAFGGRRISFLSGGGLWTSHFNNKDRSVDTQVEDFASIPIAKTDSLTCSYLELSDWIHDARLLKIQMQQEENIEYAFLLAMGMANNNCEIFGFHCKATSDEQEILLQPTRLQCITCDVRCMLYSLSFHGGWDNTNVLSSSDAKLPSLIVASGTVFSEIVVWDAIVKSQEDNDGEESLDEVVKKWLTNITAGCANNITASRIRRRSLKRLKGHLGSIFSVHFSPCGRYIASTSDDRTVRLFQMQPAMDKLDMQWQLIWSGWGHTARVFDVSFAYPSFGDGEIISSHPILVSAGEDRTTRLWSPLQAKEVAHPLRGHDCESVWTVDVCEGTIVTGGNDGCVKLWELGSHIQKGKDIRTFVVPNDPLVITTTCSTETTTTDTTATKPRKKQKKKAKTTGQLICGMELYSDHMLVVATRAGGLFSLDMKSSIWTKHKFWHHDVISSKDKSKLNIDPKTGACISVSPSAEHAIVGTTEGWLIVLSLDSPCGSSIHNERYAFHCQSHRPVQSISWIDNDNIVVFYARGSVIWFKMGKDPVPLHVMVLGTPGIPLSFAYDQQSIYIGDSRGNLAHFDISQSCENEIRPKSVLKAHKKEHVTAITVMESTGIIVSVGNDGCVQKSKVVNGELKRLIFIPVECTGLTHIWNVHQSNGQEDVILGGFYGNDYVVVDPINGYEFLRIQTGGRQKRQDFCIDFSNDSYAMAICTGQKDGSNVINFHLSDLLIDETLKSPRVNHRMIDRPYSIGVSYHTETVNDACWVKYRGDQPTYLLSGSNDCSVNLLQFRNGKFISTTKLPPHESCVRGVCSSSHPTTDTSLLVTCGGKLTMEFYLLNHSAVDVDSSLSCLCSYRTVGRGTTIDHRMNAVRAIPLPSDRGYHHFVASGDSEGNLHIVIVSEHSKSRNTTIGEILEGNGRPVLCLELISFNGFVFVAVGTTGGDIQLWAFNITILSGCCNRAEDEFYNLKGVHPTKVCEFKAHQSGVNDMSVAAIPGEENNSDAGKFALLSVGDDQAVSACIISFEKRLEKGQLCCKNIRLSTTSCASASALKSVHVVLDETTFHRVYTTGHDERVTLWEFDAVGISLKYITCVPIGTEGSCLDCFQYTRPDGTLTEVCAVGGAGTELLSLNLSALMAACAVRNANFLLITAGAGFSKDSGLTTYEEAPGKSDSSLQKRSATYL
jgi:WD40 repeat protein